MFKKASVLFVFMAFLVISIAYISTAYFSSTSLLLSANEKKQKEIPALSREGIELRVGAQEKSFSASSYAPDSYFDNYTSNRLCAPPSHLWDAVALEGVSESAFTQPKIFDLDGDGKKEIIASLMEASVQPSCSIHQGVYVWDSNGSLRQGFPVYLNRLSFPTLCSYLSIVGVGDVIGDKKSEIIVATGRSGYGGGVYVISSSGQILTEINVNEGFSGIDYNHVVIADMDKDMKEEILVSTEAGPSAKLYAFDGNGSVLQGWPKVSSSSQFIIREPALLSSNQNEKLVVTSYRPTVALPTVVERIVAYNFKGQEKWSFSLPALVQTKSNLIVGDVNSDGKQDIIFYVQSPTQSNLSEIYILNREGTLQAHWPAPLDWSYNYDLSLGDLNLDGILEIIYHDSTKVFVSDAQGHTREGFPRSINQAVNYSHLECISNACTLVNGSAESSENECTTIGAVCGEPINSSATHLACISHACVVVNGSGTDSCSDNPPLPCGPDPEPLYSHLTTFGVADLDCDNYPDIYSEAIYRDRSPEIESHMYSIFAFNRFGNAVRGFPFHLDNYQEIPQNVFWTLGERYPPTITDLDNNGKSDIVVSKGWGRIEALKLSSTYKPRMAPYPEYGADVCNTKSI